jgi:ribose/xylose/arabinose/galactoside ABC-type transport system permease subunit
MNRFSRILFIAMTSLFAICAGGVIGGMLYSLYATYARHCHFDAVLSASIPYYKVVGGIGILGMLFFFVFLFLLISSNKGKPS